MKAYSRKYRISGWDEAKDLAKKFEERFSPELKNLKPSKTFIKRETPDYQADFKYNIYRRTDVSWIGEWLGSINRLENSSAGIVEILENEKEIIQFFDNYQYLNGLKGGERHGV